MTKKKIKLLYVPKEQKDWFNKEFYSVNDENYPTDGASFDMLKNNLLGHNDRFIDWNYDAMGLLDGFWMGYSSGGNSKLTTEYFLDICFWALQKAKQLEFYELAYNIKLVYESITTVISENEARFIEHEFNNQPF